MSTAGAVAPKKGAYNNPRERDQGNLSSAQHRSSSCAVAGLMAVRYGTVIQASRSLLVV